MRMIGAAGLVAVCGMSGVRAGAGRWRAGLQGQRHRRHHRLSRWRPQTDVRQLAVDALRAVRQGGEIPGRGSPIWRLHLVRLPLGAVRRQHPAAGHPLLNRASDPTTARVRMTRRPGSLLPGGWSAGALPGVRGARGRDAVAQAGAVGNEDGQERLAAARHDDAALHRRDHRQGDERSTFAGIEGSLLQQRRPADRDRLRHQFRLQRRRPVDDLAFGNHRAISIPPTRVRTTTHGEQGAAGHDIKMTIEAKWLGTCKPGQKPGDIVMPGGLSSTSGMPNGSRACCRNSGHFTFPACAAALPLPLAGEGWGGGVSA